jgi:hypothetical protein
MRYRGGHRTSPGDALQRLRTSSPRRRRAQLGGLFTLCALATGSTAALLAVGNAGVDLVTLTPMSEGASGGGLPPAADGKASPYPHSAVPSRAPVFGWSPGAGRRSYVARSPSARAENRPWRLRSSLEALIPGQFAVPLDVPENLAVPASPGEGLAPPGEFAPTGSGHGHRHRRRMSSEAPGAPAAGPAGTGRPAPARRPRCRPELLLPDGRRVAEAEPRVAVGSSTGLWNAVERGLAPSRGAAKPTGGVPADSLNDSSVPSPSAGHVPSGPANPASTAQVRVSAGAAEAPGLEATGGVDASATAEAPSGMARPEVPARPSALIGGPSPLTAPSAQVAVPQPTAENHALSGDG